MAGYIVNALPLKHSGPPSHVLLAVSVFDSNGAGATHLSESNFAVHNITSEDRFAVAEVQSSGVKGFYRLFLRTEPTTAHAEECVLALVVMGPQRVAGRVPGTQDSGNAMVKVRVAE